MRDRPEDSVDKAPQFEVAVPTRNRYELLGGRRGGNEEEQGK